MNDEPRETGWLFATRSRGKRIWGPWEWMGASLQTRAKGTRAYGRITANVILCLVLAMSHGCEQS